MLTRVGYDVCCFTDSDVRYAQTWARTMSVASWWLVIDPSLSGIGWSTITVVEPTGKQLLILRPVPGRVTAVRPEIGFTTCHRSVRAALSAFRRPRAADLRQMAS